MNWEGEELVRLGLGRKMWKAWDHIFHIMARVQTLDGEEPRLFMVAKRRYLGRSFEVDGVVVQNRDPIIELHMNNVLLERILSEENSLVGLAVRLLQEAKRTLPALAKQVRLPDYRDVEVLLGVTFIHRGVERLGFQSFPLRSTLIQKLSTWYLYQVFKSFNKNAENIVRNHPNAFVPKVVAISKEKLLTMYGGEPRSATSDKPKD